MLKRAPRSSKPRLLLVFPPTATATQHREVRRWLTRGGLTAKKLDIKLLTWPEAFEEPAHGPQQIPQFVTHGEALLEALTRYEPEILILMSAVMMEGFQMLLAKDERILQCVGEGRFPMRRFTQTRIKTFIDRRRHTLVLSFPLPSRSTNWVADEIVLSLEALEKELRWRV